MEVSALSHPSGISGLRGPSPLLRLQSDERLIALTRRGHHAAFETLFGRYQSRLLAFCRHMLSSREDAEDVLQEVFAAAFNAVLADDRPINVRPWLYRIARNRSLNHLRRSSATGVDSMDVHFADHGLSTGDKVLRRESFRELVADVHDLPETQRTALLLREIDALSYDQIAQAMETTVPSVKSLLVRARISLAEAAEARKMSCEEVRLELGEAAEGLVKLGTPARRHVRSCDRCSFFKRQLRQNNKALAAVMPVAPLLLAKKLILAKFGSTASAGAGHVAGGAGAMGAGAVGAGAAAGGGASVAGGLMTAGAGALATKAVAGLAAAALVTAGAVAADHAAVTPHRHHRAPVAAADMSAAVSVAAPAVAAQQAQPVSVGGTVEHRILASAARHRHAKALKSAKATLPAAATAPAVVPATATTPAPVIPPTTKPATEPPTQVTEVTTETTQLPPAPAGAETTTTTTTTATTPAPPPPSEEPVASTEPTPAPAEETPATRRRTGGTEAPTASGARLQRRLIRAGRERAGG